MRVAVCLSGQVRTIQHGWQSLMEHIIVPLNADIFLHTWNDSLGKGSDFTSVGCFFQDKNLTGKKIESYNEWQKNKKDSTYPTQSPMFYSMFESNKLKKDHEEKNNFIYDVVIRVRMDCLFKEQIPLNEIWDVLHNKETYYIRGEGTNVNLNGFYLQGQYFICDIFFFGSSQTMDKLTSVYEHPEILNRKTQDLDDSEKKLGHISWMHSLVPKNSEIRFYRQKKDSIFFSNYQDEGYKEIKHMNYDVKKYGLKFRPDIGDNNSKDWLVSYLPNPNFVVPVEFSTNNAVVLKDVLETLGDKCQAILEIGCKNHISGNSTDTIRLNKPKSAKQFCVDLNETSLAGLENLEDNIWALCINSSEYDKIVTVMNNKGVEKLDLLFIDGYHSVDQVLDDWRFVNLLSDNGVVILHDTNYHPGPVEFLKAIDESVWDVQQFFKGEVDWGIAVLRKK